jgi:peptide/nickel transport system permease protein
MVPILLLVALIAFMLMHLTPGDPAAIMLGPEAMPKDIEQLRHELGLTRPIPVQFVIWLSRALQGNFGNSYYYGKPVLIVIMERLEPTFLLTIYSLIISILIGIPCGVIAAVRSNSATDQATMIMALLGVSMPQFWLALNMIIFLCRLSGLVPSHGLSTAVFRVWPQFLLSFLCPPSLWGSLMLPLLPG